jgi:hypothetical protein
MLKQILDSGTLIGEGMEAQIGELQKDHIEFFMSLENKPLVFDKNVLKAVVEPEIKFLGNKYCSDKKSMQDIVNEENDRYTVLKLELMKSSDMKQELDNLCSVKNLGFEKCSIIGIVRGNELEDQTGRVVFESKVPLFEGDVVGATGKKMNGKFFAEKIIFPGCIKEKITRSVQPSKVLLARKAPESLFSKINYAILLEPQELPKRIATLQLDGKADFDVSGVKFLLCKEAIGLGMEKLSGNDEINVAEAILIRRNIFSGWIKEVPDVFVSLSEKSFVVEKNGVIFVGIGQKPIILDLQTGKWDINE